eukprot:Ihof_evm3s263 gene=Ihof_evmTU3s263
MSLNIPIDTHRPRPNEGIPTYNMREEGLQTDPLNFVHITSTNPFIILQKN